MPRLPAVETRDANPLTRFIYFMTKRKVGRVVYPIKVAAHHRRLLFAVGQMELGQEAAQSVDFQLKQLALLKVARLIGCPF